MNACPPDAAFTRLVEGALSPEEIRNLEVHCDGCVACGRTLAELARTITPGNEGDLVGDRYRLLESVGAGGMGVVYTAFDTKLRRKVAVKRLRETGTGPAAERRRARFLREAQLLASLSHPNVLTVHDVGGIEGGLYVVMELVDGWPMSRWSSEAGGSRSWRRVVDLYLQAGRGLSAAHQVGVVHRDVKPENILVARSGRVLIGDFGLAGLTTTAEASRDAPASALALTQTGSVLGTPAYMAPEQHDGKSSDALSDQFSFCVSLFESLHGRRPFKGQTGPEIAAAARATMPPPGQDGVPRIVDRVVFTGLAADPTNRHRSIDDLLSALTRARDRAIGRPLFVAVGLAVIAATAVAGGVLRGRSAPQAVSVAPAARVEVARPAPPDLPATAPPRMDPPQAPATPLPQGARPADKRVDAAKEATAGARARQWARAHPESDPQLLMLLADRAHAERDGGACLLALKQIPSDAWPWSLAERALRRRASCEMLAGNCDRGGHLLATVEGATGTHAAQLANCPPGSLTSIDDRILAVATQADDARYAGNRVTRRRELQAMLARQAATREIQSCFTNPSVSRACARRLAALARAYQVMAESFLLAGDCADGARLDVMHSQAKFQSLQPNAGDPALRCRSARIFEAYKTCVSAGGEAERLCLARLTR